jgi:hypothetical protein
MTVATKGFNPLNLRSFEIAASTTSAPSNGATIGPGAYELTTDVACTVMIGAGSGNITATKLSATTTQPAAGSPNRLFKLAAGQSKMVEIRTAGKIAVITDSATGWLAVSGPFGKGGIP